MLLCNLCDVIYLILCKERSLYFFLYISFHASSAFLCLFFVQFLWQWREKLELAAAKWTGMFWSGLFIGKFTIGSSVQMVSRLVIFSCTDDRRAGDLGLCQSDHKNVASLHLLHRYMPPFLLSQHYFTHNCSYKSSNFMIMWLILCTTMRNRRYFKVKWEPWVGVLVEI